MIDGTEETHFSVMFMLTKEYLEDALKYYKTTEKPIVLGVTIEVQDSKYKTFTDSAVPYHRVVTVGDQSNLGGL